PGELAANITKAIGAKSAGENQRRIDEGPLMRMLGVLPAEIREELARFGLEIPRQGSREEIGFFELDFGLVVFVQLENNVAEALQIGIDGAIHCDLGIAQRKTALDRIVITELKILRGIT